MKNRVFPVLVLAASCAVAGAKEDFEKAILAQTGGSIEKPGVGFVAICNNQKAVSSDSVQGAISYLRKETSLFFKLIENGEGESGAGVTIRLVSDPKKPPMLVAPEMGWAEINVDALAPDLKSDAARKKFLPTRLQKMILRAFVYANGAGGSGYTGNILDTVGVRELDYLDLNLPVDAVSRAIEHAIRRKLIPSETVSYHQACQEGWAPQPTNEIQKTIWEKVHTPPSKPIKITYDKDKQKPVVK